MPQCYTYTYDLYVMRVMHVILRKCKPRPTRSIEGNEKCETKTEVSKYGELMRHESPSKLSQKKKLEFQKQIERQTKSHRAFPLYVKTGVSGRYHNLAESRTTLSTASAK